MQSLLIAVTPAYELLTATNHRRSGPEGTTKPRRVTKMARSRLALAKASQSRPCSQLGNFGNAGDTRGRDVDWRRRLQLQMHRYRDRGSSLSECGYNPCLHRQDGIGYCKPLGRRVRMARESLASSVYVSLQPHGIIRNSGILAMLATTRVAAHTCLVSK